MCVFNMDVLTHISTFFIIFLIIVICLMTCIILYEIWGVFKTDWISRLKNDLNKFILTKMDNNPTNEEIETLIKAGDIIDKYRQ